MNKEQLRERLEEKVRGILFASFGATAISVSVNDGNVTDGTIAIRDKAIKEVLDLFDTLLKEKEAGCPPHNFVPYTFEGAWGGSVPPPNMRCTKCLLTERF